MIVEQFWIEFTDRTKKQVLIPNNKTYKVLMPQKNAACACTIINVTFAKFFCNEAYAHPFKGHR